MDAARDEFIRLYTSAQPALHRFVCARIPDVHVAEDVMQEVGIALWKQFESYTPGSPFVRWAMQVAHYEIQHARRSHARRSRVMVFDDQLLEAAMAHYEEFTFERAEERRRALDACVGRLRGEQRALLETRYRARQSCVAIAAGMNCGVSKVRMQLLRIREALRRCIDTRLAGSDGRIAGGVSV